MPDSYSRIALQQPLALQKASHALRIGMGKLGEFVARRRLDPAKPHGGSVDTVDIDTIQKQHVEMDIRSQRAAETLDQGDGAGVCRRLGVAGFLGQMGSNGAIDDAQHLTHDRRLAGK